MTGLQTLVTRVLGIYVLYYAEFPFNKTFIYSLCNM